MTVRALVTNDDGPGSTGLAALARAAQQAGLEVTVAAPSWDTSGSSCALTGVQEVGRLAIAPCELPDFDGQCYAVDAAPAMITLVALRGGFGPPPDVVLSGVNRGRNTGRAVIHSGTVGAVMTAVNHGFAGIAIGAIQTNVSDASEGFLRMTYEAVVDDPEPGSDADLLRQGWVTVSAIHPLAEVAIELPELLIRS